MAKILRFFILTGITQFCFTGLFSQTSLYGKITDKETKAPLDYATVQLFKNGVFVNGNLTDEDGTFNFSPLDPGTYDVEFSFTGYGTQTVQGVQVLAGKAIKLDMALSAGVLLEIGATVVAYKSPIVERDNTTQGIVVTSDQIRNLPSRDIGAIAATSAGVSSADEGDALTIRGSRPNANDVYIDGMRTQGNLIPETEIEQLQVITGGVEAQYGDVTGGIISITTKGPASKLTGGFDIESSNAFDAYKNNIIGLNLSGPLIKKNDKESILGFRFSGRYTDNTDGDPPGIPVYRIKDARLADLEANPLTVRNGSPFVNADLNTANDVDALQAKPFERDKRLDITGKLDARLTRAVDISLSGAYTQSESKFTPGGWRLYNSHNNPLATGNNIRSNFRFRHRIGQTDLATGQQQTSRSVLQNASYTLQVGYEKNQNNQFDSRHDDKLFNYGHVGTFDIEWIPSFAEFFDPNIGENVLLHTDYRQVLRGYKPGSTNQVLSNYNNAMELDFNEGLNGNIPGYLITTAGGDNSNILARTAFLAPNGAISGIYTNSWNLHTNVGVVYNLYSKGENDQYSFNANASFDLAPAGGADKSGRHSIQFGVLYEQRINRAYNIAPIGLWDIARQQANNHILGIAEGADTVNYVDIPDFPNTALRRVSYVDGADNQFYKKIREITGQNLTDYVNIDGLDPSQFSLDMFSAKELNDQGILGYLGYDYLGNKFDGNFEDFFTARDANGIRTFPVAPNRPIYSAAYIQDKFTFRDIIFRLGVRVDRYDANTKVLKDNYSLYEIMGAGEYHSRSGDERPGNIGDDFKVYLDETGSSVAGYRNGDDWYARNGTPVNNPANLFSGGLVFPKYADERVEDDLNFIKSRDFDPNVSFTDYEAQVSIMPRLAFSFPISEEANFFAHYDILVQRPPSNTIATARDYFYFTDDNSIKNNPNLKPERTIDYEVGFQQQLTTFSGIKISAYYKDLRNMIQQRTFFPVPVLIQYTTYDNLDFGTVKGFSFQFDKRTRSNISILANYTLQLADGTGSNANSQRGLTSRGNLRNLFALDFDERHRFVTNVDYRFGNDSYNGPELFGAKLFANAGLNLQAIMVSGRPYTAKEEPAEFGGTLTKGAINGARKPWNFTLNARVDKSFALKGGGYLNVYVRASNILDRRNVVNVYPATGSATDDGFLASTRGQDQLNNINPSLLESYLASYQWALLNPDFFTLPRRVFLGAIFNF